MKVAFLDVESDKKIYRDYNGGYGTSFQVGASFLGKMLTYMRTNKEKFPYMPYAYGATIFKQGGHDVSVETNTLPDADLVIMHASMPNHSHEIKYLRKLKEENIPVGIIGPFASSRPELFADASFIVMNDSESIMKDIANTGIIPQGQVYSPPLENLDELPYPDWSLFPINEYSYSPIINKKPFTFVLSSRGCSYGCNYCPYISASNNGRKFRKRSVNNIIGELKYLTEKFGIKGVQFRDPIFTLDLKRIEELCTAIITAGINLEMGCETRSDRLNGDLLDLMYKAGFRALKLGIESASPEILRKSKRLPIELEHQEYIIRHCKKIGIKVIGFYIIGLEKDTPETVKSTMAYAKLLNTDFANFTLCTPIPGTEFYEKIKDQIYDHNFDHYDNFHQVFRHENLTEKEILQFREKAFVSYYFRPRYISQFLKNIILR